MSYTVTQMPTNGANYAVNQVPKCIFSSVNEELTITLKVNNTAVFGGSYIADLQNKVTVDFREIIEQYLATVLPQVNRLSQDDFVKIVDIKVQGVTSQAATTRTFSAFNIRRKSETTLLTWLAQRFLTNQPIEKHTTKDAPEWLTYYDDAAEYEVVARFYKKSGGHIDTVIEYAPTDDDCYTVNVSYKRLIRNIAMLPSQLLGYYDVLLVDGDDTIVAKQRYIYDERTGREHYFCFVNACGGIDTVICQGDNVLQSETEFSIGRMGDTMRQLDEAENLRKWQQQIGFFPTEYRNWIYELMTMKKGAWEYEDNVYYPIVIQSASLTPGVFDALQNGSFTCMMADTDTAIEDRDITKSYRQSESERGGDQSKDSDMKTVNLTFEDGETDEIDLNSNRLLVMAIANSTVSASPAITYYVDDVAAGTFAPSTSTPVALSVSGSKIYFATENTSVTGLSVNYYQQQIS